MKIINGTVKKKKKMINDKENLCSFHQSRPVIIIVGGWTINAVLKLES